RGRRSRTVARRQTSRRQRRGSNPHGDRGLHPSRAIHGGNHAATDLARDRALAQGVLRRRAANATRPAMLQSLTLLFRVSYYLLNGSRPHFYRYRTLRRLFILRCAFRGKPGGGGHSGGGQLKSVISHFTRIEIESFSRQPKNISRRLMAAPALLSVIVVLVFHDPDRDRQKQMPRPE